MLLYPIVCIFQGISPRFKRQQATPPTARPCVGPCGFTQAATRPSIWLCGIMTSFYKYPCSHNFSDFYSKFHCELELGFGRKIKAVVKNTFSSIIINFTTLTFIKGIAQWHPRQLIWILVEWLVGRLKELHQPRDRSRIKGAFTMNSIVFDSFHFVQYYSSKRR